jgi:hypothetical protein
MLPLSSTKVVLLHKRQPYPLNRKSLGMYPAYEANRISIAAVMDVITMLQWH